MDQSNINIAKFFFVVQAVAVLACLAIVFLSEFTRVFGDGSRESIIFWSIIGLAALPVSIVLILYLLCGNAVDMAERGLIHLFFITLVGPVMIFIGWLFARMQIDQVSTARQDPHIQIFAIAFGAFIFFSSVIIGLLFTLIASFFFEWKLGKALEEKL